MSPRASTALLFVLTTAHALASAEPFRDPNLPLDRRVDDPVFRLTLDEKIAMLGQVGLGETRDPEILRQVGAVEGCEARVYFKRFDGARVGPAIRAPNVDPVRDPRWGRTEESFGEAPWLVGKMSVADVRLEKTIEVKE